MSPYGITAPQWVKWSSLNMNLQWGILCGIGISGLNNHISDVIEFILNLIKVQFRGLELYKELEVIIWEEFYPPGIFKRIFLFFRHIYITFYVEFSVINIANRPWKIDKNTVPMTSSNGSPFCVTDPLWGEFIGQRWIPLTKASDAELWSFLWSVPEQTVEETIKTPVIWEAIVLIMTSL